MDLLSQYKQEHPESFQEKKAAPTADEYGRAYTGMIAYVVRLSGGRFKDINQASYVLAIAVVAVLMVSALVYFGIPGFSSSPRAFVPKGYGDNLPR